MITLNDGTVLRNLEEQVLENKKQIALHWNVDRVLADFGIKVIGRLNTKEELDLVPTDNLNYGDAYLIGSAEPFDVWIWTRPDVNAGQEEAYWLNIGHIAIEGPQGPQGPEGPAGPQGERGNLWHTYSGFPSSNAYPNPKDGDLILRTDTYGMGDILVWRSLLNQWVLMGNIKGPQGIQGPKGDKGDPGEQGPVGPQGPQGDVGGFINIYGILSNTNQLPPPTALNNLTAAFLVGASAPYDLYIQMGANSSVATWHNTGPFNAATAVSVAGVYQNVWDADTKVDKQTGTPDSGATRGFLYGLQSDGTTPNLYKVQIQANPNTIPLRNPTGTFYVGTPTLAYECANKGYVDDNFIAKPTSTNYGVYLTPYVVTAAGQQGAMGDLIRIETGAGTNTIPRRGVNGVLDVGTPTKDDEATNKAYVDNAIFGAEAGNYDTLDSMVAAITDGEYADLYNFLYHLYNK